MKLHSLIVDNFFREPQAIREVLLRLPYADVTSPFDGVVYPDIAKDLPSVICDEFVNGLKKFMPVVKPNAIFTRLSVQGNQAPHQAHTDAVTGDYTAIVYMNLPRHCRGGTAVVVHTSGMWLNPTNNEELELWRRDTNVPEKWVNTIECPMAFNRMFLVRSDLFHRAEPFNGFGRDIHDGRLVLIMFFNVSDKAAPGLLNA